MENQDKVKCPKCGSDQIQLLNKKRFGCGRGCILGLIFLPFVLLGFTKSDKIQRVCINCKKTF